MKINEALKKERKAQHKTQAQWIKDIDMSVSHYSEIESGYQRNGKHSDIDSEDLIMLLKSNQVNLNDFFDSIEDSYVIDEKAEKCERLFKELYQAFNEANYEKAKIIRDQVQQIPNAPKKLFYCSILITADLKDDMATLDSATKERINNYLYQSQNWVDDNDILIIFGNSIPIFDKDTLVLRMKQLLRKYKKINAFPKSVQIRISTLCINYLYDAIIVRKEKDHTSDAFQLIKALPANEVFAFKKIFAKYLEDVAEGDVTYAESLRPILIRSGLKNIANKLPI